MRCPGWAPSTSTTAGEIVNGTRATITEVDREAVTITVRTDAGAELTLPRQWLERDRLRHAYALTGHKGQGMTIPDTAVERLEPDRPQASSESC